MLTCSEYEFTEEAKSLLEGIEGPISVISIAGGYRQGKSFLLNRLLLRIKKGFDVGGTINACTKGIWVWSQVLQGEYNGKAINILVTDTEGLASVKVSPGHDLKIFTLSILTCSHFFYNSMRTIDEDGINKLYVCV